MAIYLGLDIGTSTIKSILLDTDLGKIISKADVNTPVQHTNKQQAHHDPDELINAVYKCIRKATQGYEVDGLGISSFAEAGIPLDSSGKPLFPIIAWFDPRSEPQVDAFLQHIPQHEIEFITGQKPGFSFGLFKYLWIKENHPEIIKDMKFWLSTPDYVLYRMTGKMCTDYTQASRTMLFDQNHLTWSETILNKACLEKDALPAVKPSGSIVGTLTQSAAKSTGLPEGIPCCLGGHDHLCGTYASGGYDPSAIIDSSGSSQAIIALTDTYSPSEAIYQHGYVHYHHVTPDQFCIKGGIKAAGKAVQWLVELFKLESIPSITELLENRLSEKATFPLMLPYFQGSGTPHREPFTQAALFGLTVGQSHNDILLALYEGMGFWLRENIDAISLLTKRNYQSIIAIGGTNHNKDLLTAKANITNLPVLIPEIPEPSAVGAALLAAVGCSTYQNHQQAQQSLDYRRTTIKPNTNYTSYYESIYDEVFIPAKSASIELLRNYTQLQHNFLLNKKEDK